MAGRKGLSDRVHHYEMRDTRDFAFGASPSYRTVGGTAGTLGRVRVQAWYTTGNGAAALDTARSALSTFEATYGGYQWPSLVVAQTGREQSGNEYPGIVFLGGPVMANREAVAHEVAHQWWYAMVGNDQINEPWIDEGLAQFSADYFFGRFDPYKSVRPINSPVYDYPDIDARETWRDPDSYNQTVYYKSSLFFDGLRGSLGNEAFFEALRTLVEENRNGVLTTAELVGAMTRFGADSGYLRQFLRLQ
jgi:aminopeptidase N